jgi:hypothetical protein
MKHFLQELAEKIYQQHPKLDDVTVVFPNRRASLYFRKHLGSFITKPTFSPALLTIEDFITGFSILKVPEKLELIHRLYETYQSVVHPSVTPEEDPAEPFDQFFFWGDMLLRDFDEVDKYMVDADHIFKDLSHLKELDTSFDFLTEEQQTFLKSFWNNFDENQSINKKRFLRVWRQLPQVYKHFKQALKDKGLAYEGMLHREVAEQLKTISETPQFPVYSKIIFAGFNALTTAEEKIISWFVEQKIAEVYWDMDAYYVNNVTQEAGRFFREYQLHPILGKTFSQEIPSNFIEKKNADGNTPAVKLFGAAQPVGQAKLMAQVLQEQLARGINPEETLIVLPDEKLLIPVLHGISGNVDKLNVTMGFPLSSTPLFNFIELLIDLQVSAKPDGFNHRQVLAILAHPYVVAADAISPNTKRKEILKHNWVHIPKGYLATEVPLHRLIFQELAEASTAPTVTTQIIHYLRSIVNAIGSLKTIGEFDKEYAFHFVRFFNQLEDILKKEETSVSARAKESNNAKASATHDRKKIKASLKSFLRLFRQLIRSQKIPFAGEPLKGLQVMGVLETRNLDFKNVFVLSLNEGAFPSISSKGSYIPFNIRKAYKLPTVEHQDAMYSYLFYRTLQRAENIFLFYNSETDILGQGEMSRYLQQLLFESGVPVEKKILHNPIQPQGINPIVVKKNATVLEDLRKLNEGNSYFRGISPSALNSYIECRLKFYFRHIAKIKEPNEVEEELDARVLGNFLHDVMERFYKQMRERKKSKRIEEEDFKNYEAAIDALIDEVFIETYRLEPGKKVEYEGQRLVVREVVKRFAHRIVEMDKAYAPFTMEALEQDGLTYSVAINHAPFRAVIGGKIDRVDRKEDQLRVIDYKTGKDKLNFDSIASLFARDGKRNKAAFQTMLYALLYKQSLTDARNYTAGIKLVPGLINRMNLFDESFSFGLKVGKDLITDVEPFLPEFEARLRELFEELFDPAQPFDQTPETEGCRLCPYHQVCYR